MEFESKEYTRYSNFKTTEAEYPYILIRDAIAEMAYLIDGLEEGDLPLIVDVDGVYHEVRRIKRSLLTLKNIMNVRKFIVGTENGEVEINTMEDLLENDIKWI